MNTRFWRSDTEAFFEEFGFTEPRWLGGSSSEFNSYRVLERKSGLCRVVKVFRFSEEGFEDGIESTRGVQWSGRREAVAKRREEARRIIRGRLERQNGLLEEIAPAFVFIRDEADSIIVKRRHCDVSIAQLIEGQVQLDDSDLFTLAGTLFAALEAFHLRSGAGHGAITPGNILYDGDPSEGRVHVFLTDSLAPEECGAGPAGDFRNLGAIVCGLIERKWMNPGVNYEDLLMRLSASEWPWLGTAADEWILFCRDLLEANPEQAKSRLEKIGTLTKRPRRSPTWKLARQLTAEFFPTKRVRPPGSRPSVAEEPDFSTIPGAFLPKPGEGETATPRGLWEVLGPGSPGVSEDVVLQESVPVAPLRSPSEELEVGDLPPEELVPLLVGMLEQDSSDRRVVIRFVETTVGNLPDSLPIEPAGVVEGLHRLSSLGISKADFALGKLHDFHGDHAMALQCYEKAYLRDSTPPTDLLFRLGTIYLETPRDPERWSRGVEMLLRAHRLGDFHATFKLGLCLQKGRGIGKDEVQAYELYRDSWRRSSREGRPFYPARVQMAECQFRGKGIVANPSIGFQYLLEAAGKGKHPKAIENLIQCYTHGLGTDVDKALADHWRGILESLR